MRFDLDVLPFSELRQVEVEAEAEVKVKVKVKVKVENPEGWESQANQAMLFSFRTTIRQRPIEAIAKKFLPALRHKATRLYTDLIFS